MKLPSPARSWALPSAPDSSAYASLIREIESAPLLDGAELFRSACVNDFYFFNRHCLSVGRFLCDDAYLKKWYKKPWLDHPWVFERCREIQESQDGHLDLWPRFHWKTTLITQNLSLWEFLWRPNLKVGIGTHKVDMTGEAMIRQMKNELEQNEKLRWHFPGTFYWDPERESSEWGTTRLRFRQHGSPREPSIMIFSVTGALPTSFHFDIIVLDDLVVEKSVENAEAIEKTTEGWRRTAGLGGDNTRRRMVGTHWKHNDSYKYILDLGAARLRYHDAYEADGVTPVLRSREWIEGDPENGYAGMKMIMGPVNFAAQIRNKPSLGTVHSFKPEKLSYYDEPAEQIARRCRVYALADTSSARTKDSDYNAGIVIGVGRGVPWPHVYLLDAFYDRLTLPDLDDRLFDFAKRWRPWWTLIEQMGAQRDDEHLRGEMMARGFQFRVKGVQYADPKAVRILRLQTPLERGTLHFPRHLVRSRDGRNADLIRVLILEQLMPWTPAGGVDHDDMIDVMSMVFAPEVSRFLTPPEGSPHEEEERWAIDLDRAAPQPWDETTYLEQSAWAS